MSEFLDHSGPIDFRGWHFGFGTLDPAIAPALAEAVKNVLDENPPEVSLPFAWTDGDGISGPPVTDPLMLHIGIDLGDGDRWPTWSHSFTDAVKEFIDGHVAGDPPKIRDEDGVSKARQIAAALRGLAQRIDNSIEPDQAEGQR